MVLAQTLNVLGAQNIRTISSTYSTSGRECNPVEEKAFLESLTENKFLTKVLFEASQMGEEVETSREKLSSEVVQFISLNARCSVVVPDHQLRFIEGEWSGDGDGVLNTRAIVGRDQSHVSSTNLPIGGPLLLKSGWLVCDISTNVEERIGRDGKSYSGKSTIMGTWTLDPLKITRLRL